jgi:hypothetical protein
MLYEYLATLHLHDLRYRDHKYADVPRRPSVLLRWLRRRRSVHLFLRFGGSR